MSSDTKTAKTLKALEKWLQTFHGAVTEDLERLATRLDALEQDNGEGETNEGPPESEDKDEPTIEWTVEGLGAYVDRLAEGIHSRIDDNRKAVNTRITKWTDHLSGVETELEERTRRLLDRVEAIEKRTNFEAFDRALGEFFTQSAEEQIATRRRLAYLEDRLSPPETKVQNAYPEHLADQPPNRYPFEDGLSRVLGPAVIATGHEPGAEGSVINWRGANYIPQPDPCLTSPEAGLCVIEDCQVHGDKPVSVVEPNTEKVRPAGYEQPAPGGDVDYHRVNTAETEERCVRGHLLTRFECTEACARAEEAAEKPSRSQFEALKALGRLP